MTSDNQRTDVFFVRTAFVGLVLRHRWSVLAFTLFVTLLSLFYATKLGFESSLEIWFLEEDPEIATYHQFRETFETDEILIIGLFGEIFTPTSLLEIDRITRAAADASGVHRVRSLTNAQTFVREQDASIGLVPLVAQLPTTASTAEDIKKKALSDPLVADLLVARNGHAAAVVVELSLEANTFEGKAALVKALKEKAKNARLDVRFAGTPAINEAVLRYSQRDFLLLGSTAVLVILLLSFLLFRRFVLALLPLAVALLATLWTFGLMGALSLKINLVSQSLMTVILAVGVADAVHVLSDHQRSNKLAESLSQLILPCLFTTLTTAAGMLSLLSADLKPIGEFGWLAAIGVTFALLLSLTFLPALLTFIQVPPPKTDRISDTLRHLAVLPPFTRPLVLGLALISVAFSLLLLRDLEVGANPMAYFKEGDPVRREVERIDRYLGGSTSIELLVEAPNGGLKDPAVLKRLDHLQSWLEERPAVRRVLSVVDGLASFNHAMTGTRSIEGLDRAAISQSFLLMSGEEGFDTMVAGDDSIGRLSARIAMSEAAELVDEIPTIERKLSAYSSAELTVRPTGFVKLISEMEIYIVDSQVKSFLIAFALVCLLMIFILRSVPLGLFAMIPNLMPVIIGLGFMKVSGIRLDPGTAMIGSLTLGLVVDDTIHLMTRLKEEMQKGQSMEAALQRATASAGRAITITSLLLASGLGVLVLGSFTPNIFLGAVAAVVVCVAWLADLVVLPAAILTFRLEKKPQ